LILRAQEEPRIFKSGALMENGGNCSSLREAALSTSEMEEQLMQYKTKRDKKLNFKLETERINNSGRLFILTRKRLKSLRDFIQTSVCIAADHSILFQDYQ
jgi:hypothetical protein